MKKAEQRALELRDLAVHLARASTGSSYLGDGLIIEYRAAIEDRPHGVDVWRADDRTMKVLNVIWRGDDAVVVVYRGGPWERWLRRAAAAVRFAA
jgi:hypothetical protein